MNQPSYEIFKSSLNQVELNSCFDLHLIMPQSQVDVSHDFLQEGLRHTIKQIVYYTGTGWDIGAYQYHSSIFNSYDYVIYVGSNTRFNTRIFTSYIEQILIEKTLGLIGFSSSLEASPHFRTNAFMIQPWVFSSYPFPITTKDHCAKFEHSYRSIYSYCKAALIPHALLLKTGLTDLYSGISENETFRCGKQSNLLFHDRHTDIYRFSSYRQKLRLEHLKQGFNIDVAY